MLKFYNCENKKLKSFLLLIKFYEWQIFISHIVEIKNEYKNFKIFVKNQNMSRLRFYQPEYSQLGSQFFNIIIFDVLNCIPNNIYFYQYLNKLKFCKNYNEISWTLLIKL